MVGHLHMIRTQNSPKRRQEKHLSARRKHWNHMQVIDRPSLDASSLTQTIFVQMVYSKEFQKYPETCELLIQHTQCPRVPESRSVSIGGPPAGFSRQTAVLKTGQYFRDDTEKRWPPFHSLLFSYRDFPWNTRDQRRTVSGDVIHRAIPTHTGGWVVGSEFRGLMFHAISDHQTGMTRKRNETRSL